jgi:hypothetical protein
MRNKEEFSPEQRSAVIDLIRKVDPYKNAMVFGQAIIEISKQFGINPIREVEELLRDIDSDTHLVALPMDGIYQFSCRMPHTKDIEYNYYLWIGVNGEEEASKKMIEEGISREQNLENLESTGMLVPKPRSTVSQILKSPLN